MGGSTGNQSGGSSTGYPPSLYDTSVSSASGGRSYRRNIPPHGGYNQRQQQQQQQQQFGSTNTETNNQMHPQQSQKGYHPSRNASRSMDYSEYPHRRGMASRSDPGGPSLDPDQYRSESEYAHSEIAMPTSSYHDAQHRFQTSASQFQTHRLLPQHYQYLQQQHRGSNHRPQPQYSREQRATGRDHSFESNSSQDYYNEIHRPSPLDEDRPHDVLMSPSMVNIRELKKQLWDDDEVLIPSSPQTFRRVGPLLSPGQDRQIQSSDHRYRPKNVPRYARSLSPRRRKYQQTPPAVDEPTPAIGKAGSNVSDSSYNKFHSKFYQAAMVAQGRTNGSKNPHETKEPNTHMHPQQQKHEQNGRRLSSPLPFDEEYTHPQSRRPNNESSTPFPVPNASPRTNAPEMYKRAADFYKRNANKSDTNTRKPPIVPPSPSSLPSPRLVKSERQERRVDRGRAMETTPNARRIRNPSPLIQERIRSFDSDKHHGVAPGPSPSREHGNTNDNQDYYNEALPQKSGDRMEHGAQRKEDYGYTNIHDDNNVTSEENHTSEPTAPRYFANEHSSDFVGGIGRGKDITPKAVDNEHHHKVSQPNPKQQQHPSESLSDNIDGISDERMANLVDKLSAVNRENPESALAQIDSILRQESRSFHTRTVGNFRNDDGTGIEGVRRNNNDTMGPTHTGTKVENDQDEMYDDDDDDESSDVSSITNPTFQPSRLQYSKNPMYIAENDHYKVQTTISADNNFPFNPSTSSFRRPRPSHLQNYSKTTTSSRQDNTMSRSEWKRQQIQKFPPPSTIQVKDEGMMYESPRQNSADVRKQMLEKNLESTRSKKTLGKAISDKQVLAKKIRSWDELSNQVPEESIRENRNREQAMHGSLQRPKASSRHHPWDDNMKTIQTRDISMDGEIGVEAEMASAGDRFISDTRKYAAGSPSRRHRTPTNPFEIARNNVRHGNDTNPFNDDSVESSNKPKSASPQFPDISFSAEGDGSNIIPQVRTSMAGIPQFNPADVYPPIDEEKKTDERSDKKGNDWVAIPPSSFFPDINESMEPRDTSDSKTHSDPKQHSKPSATGAQKGAEWSMATAANTFKIRNDDGFTEPRFMSLACKTGGNKELKAKEKKRGFLRAFMEKKKKKELGTGYAASTATGSVGVHSASVESRGVKSMSHVHSGSNAYSARSPTGNIQILPPPHGVFDEKNTFANARGRVGNVSVSSPRGRSNSLEKFRSTNMAKKFNRVMQLYDSDEI